MTSKPKLNDIKKRRVEFGFLLLAAVVFLATLFVASSWLKTIDGPLSSWVGPAAILFSVGFAWYFSIRWQRRLDEVEKAGQMFAVRWGMSAGTAASALLMAMPPFRAFMTTFVIQHGSPGLGMTVDQSVVMFAMAMGLVGLVVMQSLGILFVSVIWWKSKQ